MKFPNVHALVYGIDDVERRNVKLFVFMKRRDCPVGQQCNNTNTAIWYITDVNLEVADREKTKLTS